STLFDYLPAGSILVTDAAWQDEAARSTAAIAERHEERRHDIEHPLLDPGELYLDADGLGAQMAQWPRISVGAAGTAAPAASLRPPPDIRLDLTAEQPLAALAALIRGSDENRRTLLMADSTGRRELLQDLLRNAGLEYQAIAD